MSQLRKQSITGRKVTRRNAPTTTSVATSSRFKLWKGRFRLFGRISGGIFTPFKFVLKRWPRASLILILTASISSALVYGTLRFMKSITSSLPETIQVESPRVELHTSVSSIANDTLNSARKDNWSRTALFDKLLSRISAVDGVDEVSIRSGLDRKVIIKLVAQAPLLVLEGSENERILIGSKFRIIARGLGRNDYNHLPKIEAPDLSLNIRMVRERKKTLSGLFIRPINTSTANIRWLSQETIKILSYFESEKIPVDVLKVIWKNGTGFSAVVRQKDSKNDGFNINATLPIGVHTVEAVSSPQIQASHQFTIVLGENQFQAKFLRLHQIIQDLRLKDSLVDHIDLAFSDKAIIKLKDQLSEFKRGGMQ